MTSGARRRLHRTEAGGIARLEDERAGDDGVGVWFHDRRGGTSAPPYDTLNLALSVGDDPRSVRHNRGTVADVDGWDLSSLGLARQVHGAAVIEVSAGRPEPLGDADVLVARRPGVVVGILSADCVPVALKGARGVAMAHAGWRGLVAGAVEAGVVAVGPVEAAWVGPGIHACCYEVSADVVAAFRSAGLPVAAEDRVDPVRAAVFALRRAGVDVIASTEDCTSCDRRYFSYRRDGVTGRQGSFITLLGRGA